MITDVGIDARIGARIRQLRAERGLTLDQLAELADVSRGMLWRIEHGDSSPTAQLLNKVCSGLGVTLSVLFAQAETRASPISRRADQPTWRDPASGYMRRNVSPTGTPSPVQIVEVEFPPRATVGFDAQPDTGADQHVWVLDGVLELEIGAEMFCLQNGDCLWMRFGRPIVFRNPTAQPVRYAVIISRGAGAP